MDSSDDWKLTDPSFFAHGDPREILTRWRQEDPVHWTEGRLARGFWSITRHADAMQVFMNENRWFSVQRWGACLPQSPDIDDVDKSVFIQLARSASQIAMMDGDPHTELRRVFAQRFSPAGVQDLNLLIKRCAREILDDVLQRGECDFVTDVAGRLPLAVIAAMMDIPKSDWEMLYRWNNMSAAPEDPEWSVGTAEETSSEGTARLVEYCTRLALERRGRDGEDLLTMLANARVDGKLLPDEHLGFNGMMFFAAGHETTRASLSAGFLELLRAPDQLRRLKADIDDVDAVGRAVEECVRWASPLTHTLRTATQDIEIGGVRIREGDWVVPWFISINFDERAFERPDRFDAARRANDHLGFAKGKHHCLGIHLARVELRAMLQMLIGELGEVELSGEPEMAASNLFWGLKHMPVSFPRSSRKAA